MCKVAATLLLPASKTLSNVFTGFIVRFAEYYFLDVVFLGVALCVAEKILAQLENFYLKDVASCSIASPASLVMA